MGRMERPANPQYNPLKGFLYSLAATVAISTNYVTAKYSMGAGVEGAGFNPETFSLVWTTSAAVFAFIIASGSGGVRKLAVPRSSVRGVLLLGGLTGVGMLLSWESVDHLEDPSFVAFLWRFTPVLTILLGAVFLRERLTVAEIVAVAVMVAGGCLATFGDIEKLGIGVLLAMLACVAAALQRFVAKLHAAAIHPSTLVFYRVGIGAVVIAVYAFALGRVHLDVPLRYWLVMMLGAFLGPCLSFQFAFRAYRCWDLARVSIVQTTEPLFVLPQSLLVLNRIPAGNELRGGCVIMAGAFALAWGKLMAQNARGGKR